MATICEAEGGSVSDLLRSAVKDLLNRNHENLDRLAARIVALTFNLEAISKDIEQIRSLVLANLQESHRRVAPKAVRLRVRGRQPESLPS